MIEILQFIFGDLFRFLGAILIIALLTQVSLIKIEIGKDDK